jgi:hypothetical protein
VAGDVNDELAALLERAYRLALWLHDSGHRCLDEESPASFGRFVASSELVAVLDEARARLITPAGTPRPARSSARPGR